MEYPQPSFATTAVVEPLLTAVVSVAQRLAVTRGSAG